MLSKTLIRLLNLTDIEQSLLASIEREDLNVSRIAEITRIPRTTLYTAIDSLLHRNMIRARKIGKSTVLSPVSRNELAETLQNESMQMVESGTFTIQKKTAQMSESRQNAMTFIHGKDAMLDVWKHMAQSCGNRFQMIQPTRSLMTVLGKYDPNVFVPINDAIKKNKVILETIVNENSFPTYMNLYKGNPQIQKQIVKSFMGRAADTTMVKNSFLKNDADLILTSRQAFLMNWDHEIGIKIENRDIVQLLHELFRLAKGHGQKVDFNEYVKKWT